MKDSVTIGLIALLYVGIIFMYLSKVKTFQRFSKDALLKVESQNFFFSRKMHNITTILIVSLFLVQLYFEVQRGRGIYGSVVFSLLLVFVLTVHFKSMASSIWLIMKEGVFLYGHKQPIEWKYIEKYSWNMKASTKYNEIYLAGEKDAKARNKLRLIIDKDLTKEAQKLFKRYSAEKI
ncbi:hypothetical protein [Serpentinicella alkaliphila]|uniref:DUF5673 domain-containing protein n=1 Tax=Serpentinicella alkaliphila TaxID=1734049 RepID=A0A4R2TS17_9FIRM|nr:hypothetical protein [Serpentinicella alkaliphila]QUH25631.1 hypothetical protein HZR23_07705 [Serpentinicella alkaliphila]TCQ06658.1 hypothetical protein EDD79_100384 [Serpentinicella alkaliphila]